MAKKISDEDRAEALDEALSAADDVRQLVGDVDDHLSSASCSESVNDVVFNLEEAEGQLAEALKLIREALKEAKPFKTAE